MKKIIKIICLSTLLQFLSIGIMGMNSELSNMIKLSESKVPPDMICSTFTSLVVDQKGNVFCVDRKGNFIIKFDPDLNYLTHFSREGKGPGEIKIEYYSPGEDRLSIDENGDLYFFDESPGRLVIFDNNGKYKRDVNIQRDYREDFRLLFRVKAVTSNTFTAALLTANKTFDLIYFQLQPPLIKVRYSNNEQRITFSYEDYFVSGISDLSYGANFKVLADKEKVVFAESQKYAVHVYDINGNKLFDILDPKKSLKNFSNKELEKIGEKFQDLKKRSYPAYRRLLKQFIGKKNVISEIKLAEGKIIVFPVMDDITVEDRFPFVTYDLKGKVIGKGFMGKIPLLIQQTYAYLIDNNTSENPLIFKYRIVKF